MLAFCAVFCLAGPIRAQDGGANSGFVPRYAVLPPKPAPAGVRAATTELPTWYGAFTYQGHRYVYNMVGTAPDTNISTTVQALIIPIRLAITTSTGSKAIYDPSQLLTNGKTVIQNIVDSPLFDATTTYVQGGVNVGTTQYIDAFQRANFWGTVSSYPNYHLLLGGPTVLPEQTLRPPANRGTTAHVNGFRAGEVNIYWLDNRLQSIMASLPQIQPNTLPIFVTYDVYLTDGGCCIAGYHSAAGAQAYAMATYVDVHGEFGEDVSALSHELGEWADDPLLHNNGNPTPCGALEVGDPLEIDLNFGTYSYAVNGSTYDLQDLVTLPYFGAPSSISVNGFFTFQGQSLSVCQNGG